MQTETIDRLFLELSQITNAKTKREINLERENEKLRETLRAIIVHEESYDKGDAFIATEARGALDAERT